MSKFPTNFIFKQLSLVETPPELFSQIVQFDEQFMDFPWSFDAWKQLKVRDDIKVGLLVEDGEIVALYLSELDSLGSRAHLLKIAVDRSKRRSGLGGQLLTLLVSSLKSGSGGSITLEVSESNDAAIGLYVKFGFRIIHKKRSFYSNGDGALVMQFSQL